MQTQQEQLIELNEMLKTVSHINVRDMSKMMFKFLRSKARQYLKICDALYSMREWDENHHDYVKRFNFRKHSSDPRSAKLAHKILDIECSKPIDPSYLALFGLA